jgi:predicted GNAT superfamily acetyltransferase
MTNAADAAAADAAAGADAAVAAAAAARASGIEVREIADLDGLDSVCRLFQEIWRPDPRNPPVTTELLRALTKAGSYVGGAFDGDTLLGACVGFFGPPPGDEMHSHIAGVSAAALGRDVGFAMKLHQRAWAMQRGVARIAWTYDPLISRNAYFNLVKLGVRPVEYLPNFYGGMHDGINVGDDTDRLLVQWDLDAPRVRAASVGTPSAGDAEAEQSAGAVVALSRSEDGRPVIAARDGQTMLVAVPRDIETLRTVEPDRAREWRVALREVLAAAMASGARVTGFDKSGWYILTRGDSA